MKILHSICQEDIGEVKWSENRLPIKDILYKLLRNKNETF